MHYSARACWLLGSAVLALVGCTPPAQVNWAPLASQPAPRFVLDPQSLPGQKDGRPTRRGRPQLVLDGTASSMCEQAIAASENDLDTRPGLLAAIAKVESGRADPHTHQTRPWPWSVNVDGDSLFFASKRQAMAAVTRALASGAGSVDVGCMQVNLQQHPAAFHTLADAFDPNVNAHYAALFLRTLWAATPTHDWNIAAGYYHSKTLTLASSYRQHVQAMLARGAPADEVAALP